MLAPYRGLVCRAYIEAVNACPFIDAGLRSALKAHERAPSFIDGLSNEFEKLAALRLKKGKRLPDDKHLKELVRDFTYGFIQAIQQKARQDYESDITKVMREQVIANQRDLDATIEGTPKGDYADLIEEGGIKSLDERDQDGKEQGWASTSSN